jgi:hypothetical protein
MRQFLIDNETAFRDLEERARRCCVRFRDQEMPPGCNPNQAGIGFEISESPPTARLFVERGIQYTGPDSTLSEWFQAGVKQFPDFSALRAWIDGPLNQAFSRQPAAGHPIDEHSVTGRTATELTDINAVNEGIRNVFHPLYLNETILFERLRRRIIGQDPALKGLAEVIANHIARKRPAHPAVVFEVGPTGVGKTRTAEMLGPVLREFDNENNGYQFLRLDMTEYQEPYRLSQLIGSPQGYVGHGEGSQLVDSLSANPRTIVLFDEIEKAHPNILRVLMNTMESGRLSNASRTPTGREIDCRRDVFIFTSNLEAREILNELESRSAFGNTAIEDEVCRRRICAQGIPQEIVGRIGRFLVFRPLSPEIRAKILAMAVAEVGEEYGLQVTYVESGVIIDIMQKTRSEGFGVRPERFLIDHLLGGAFAKAAAHGTRAPVTVVGPPYECRY